MPIYIKEYAVMNNLTKKIEQVNFLNAEQFYRYHLSIIK